jgi:DNA-binding NarL/FixJ family response regulator
VTPSTFNTAANGPVRVAVVERHPTLRNTLATVLEHDPGFRCHAAYPDGETAIRDIPASRPDVVLLDLSLPRMSALECLQQLRRLGCNVPVIAFAQFFDPQQEEEILSAGAAAYLNKIVTLQELFAALRKARSPAASAPCS